jgi:putative flippase GtrA
VSETPKPEKLLWTEGSRFLKFCIIGAGSFLLSLAVFNASYLLTGRLVFSNTLAYVFSVANSFVWNRVWTFRDKRGEATWRQAARFVTANVVGYGISIGVYTLALAALVAFESGAFNGHVFFNTISVILHGRAPRYSFLLVNLAGIVSTGVIIVWNYLASRFWSFRR